MVHKLLTDTQVSGAGTRYLIQHSAGSVKNNSIPWLAHQLIGLEDVGAVAASEMALINVSSGFISPAQAKI